MPAADAEVQLSGLRLNLRIVSVVIFNFASYLTIGLPLAVLPGYVHDVMGFISNICHLFGYRRIADSAFMRCIGDLIHRLTHSLNRLSKSFG